MGEIPRSREDATTPLKTVRPDAMTPVRDVRGDPKEHTEFEKAQQQQDSSSPSDSVAVVGRQLLRPPSDCTENNRGMRVRVLDAIVTCLETKRPSWQKARILHLSSQLEESMFFSGGSMAEYGDTSTLPARINHHCLLLATRKTASNQTAAAAVAPNNVAACVTISPPPLPLPPPATAFASANPSLFANSLHQRGRGVFIQQAEEDGGNGPVPSPASGVETGIVCCSGRGGGGARARSGTRVQEAVEGKEGGMLSEASSHGRTSAVTPPPLPPPPPPSHVSLRQESRASSLPMEAVTPRSHARGADFYIDGDDCGADAGAGGYSDTADCALKSMVSESDTADCALKSMVSDENGPDVVSVSRGGKGDEPTPLSLSSGNIVACQRSDVGGAVGSGGGRGDQHAQAMAAVVGAALRAEEGWEREEEEEPRGARLVSEALSEGAVEAKADAAKEKEAKQHALRLLQCRLLLLTHASSCSEAGGSCQLSPLCDSVRQLLDHMPACADGKTCEFAHCASSKAVLQHQHLCGDSRCQLCGSVRALSQKCFWANARHAHKRRLQESYEMRRLKRQSEGKSVALPRKPQTDKAKSGRETCSGLDEAGNDLGDISLGFFLRQVKAVKARKVSRENAEVSQANGGGHQNTRTPTPSSVGSCSLLPPPPPDVHPNHQQQQQQPQPTPGHELRDATVATAANVSAPQPPTTIMPTCYTVPPLSSSSDAGGGGDGGESRDGGDGDGGPKKRGRVRVVERVGGGFSTPCKSRNTMTVTPVLLGSRFVAPLPAPAPKTAAVVASGARVVGLGAGHSDKGKDKDKYGNGNDREGEEEEDVSGGGAEARAVRAYSGEARGPTARGGGVTVVIPPPGLGAGHLRSPSEVMLGDIAESLADTTKKHSFARIQSVQAFLDEHEELRASASFGDVSAMVEQWMSLEDGMGDDDHLGLSSAFSF